MDDGSDAVAGWAAEAATGRKAAPFRAAPHSLQ
jgi:hypothetical protein